MVRVIRAALRLLGWGVFWFLILSYLILVGSAREGNAMIEITQRVKYDQQYEVGQRADHLPAADEKNLVAGGYAKFADAVPTPEEGDAPAGGSGQEEAPAAEPEPTTSEPKEATDEEAGGEGQDAPDEQPPSADPKDALKCPAGCNGGKPFGSKVALKMHQLKKGH